MYPHCPGYHWFVSIICNWFFPLLHSLHKFGCIIIGALVLNTYHVQFICIIILVFTVYYLSNLIIFNCLFHSPALMGNVQLSCLIYCTPAYKIVPTCIGISAGESGLGLLLLRGCHTSKLIVLNVASNKVCENIPSVLCGCQELAGEGKDGQISQEDESSVLWDLCQEQF